MRLLKPTDAPIVIVTELVEHYEMTGAFLFSCDKSSAVLYMCKIEEGLTHFGDTGIRFEQCPKGIIVRRVGDSSLLVQKIVPTPEGPTVQEVHRRAHQANHRPVSAARVRYGYHAQEAPHGGPEHAPDRRVDTQLFGEADMKQGPGPISEVARLLYMDAQTTKQPQVSAQGPTPGVVDLEQLFITLRSQAAQIATERGDQSVLVCDRFGFLYRRGFVFTHPQR